MSEYKYLNTAISATTSTAGSIINDSLNLVEQGTDEDQRVGRSIFVTEVAAKYTITLPTVTASATQPDSDVVRVVVFLDFQANGTTAAVTDVLDSVDIHSFVNLANQERFLVMEDKILDIVALATDYISGAANYYSPSVHVEDSFSQFTMFGVDFSGTTGVIGEVSSANVGILAISLNGIATIEGIARIRFID